MEEEQLGVEKEGYEEEEGAVETKRTIRKGRGKKKMKRQDSEWEEEEVDE